MPRYIDAFKLIEYANNIKDKTIDANDIARFPAEDVAPVKHGYWKVENKNSVYCSSCGFHELYIRHYCPSCGCLMDEVSE